MVDEQGLRSEDVVVAGPGESDGEWEGTCGVELKVGQSLNFSLGLQLCQ